MSARQTESPTLTHRGIPYFYVGLTRTDIKMITILLSMKHISICYVLTKFYSGAIIVLLFKFYTNAMLFKQTVLKKVKRIREICCSLCSTMVNWKDALIN